MRLSKTILVITQFKNLPVQSLTAFQNIILSKANSLKIMMPDARVHKNEEYCWDMKESVTH